MKLTAALVAIALRVACLGCQVGASALPSETLYEARALDPSSSSSHKISQDKYLRVSPTLQRRLCSTYQEATPGEQKELQHIMESFYRPHPGQGGGHASLEKRSDDGCEYRFYSEYRKPSMSATHLT